MVGCGTETLGCYGSALRGKLKKRRIYYCNRYGRRCEYPVYGGNGLRGHFLEYTHEGEFALIGRQGALCGNVNYASGKFWASEHAIVVSPTKELIVRYIGELLRAMNLNQYSVAAAQPGLSAEQIGRLIIPLPAEKEQHTIARFLDHKTAQIDALIAKIETIRLAHNIYLHTGGADA